MRLYTVGHGTRSLDELIDILHASAVTVLVDVRRYPASRRNPQYSEAVLATSLPPLGIEYVGKGETLGGRRHGAEPSRHPAWRVAAFRAYADHMDTDAFRLALDNLLADARKRATAVMCAETLWWRCHRRLIADAATLAGADVVHLGLGAPQPHRLHPAVRADEAGRPVYDVGVQPELGT